MSLGDSRPLLLFETFGRPSGQRALAINQRIVDGLVNALRYAPANEGMYILLKSPRAGYGKTVVLQRTAEALAGEFHFSEITPSGNGELNSASFLEGILRSLSTPIEEIGGLTELDYAVRRLLALGLTPLLESGEVPSQDRDAALEAIRERPVDTFDFHDAQAATAHWTQSNFKVLAPRFTTVISELSGVGIRQTAYWVELLFHYSATPPENVVRNRILFETIFEKAAQLSYDGASEVLRSLLGLLSLVMRPVLVLDETESLSGHKDKALVLASFLANIRSSCPNVSLLLSVNEDVWESGFLPNLPKGLYDRLTEVSLEFEILTDNEIEILLQERFPDHVSYLLSNLYLTDEERYSRKILKSAAELVANLEYEQAGQEQLYYQEAERVISPEELEQNENIAPMPFVPQSQEYSRTTEAFLPQDQQYEEENASYEQGEDYLPQEPFPSSELLTEEPVYEGESPLESFEQAKEEYIKEAANIQDGYNTEEEVVIEKQIADPSEELDQPVVSQEEPESAIEEKKEEEFAEKVKSSEEASSWVEEAVQEEMKKVEPAAPVPSVANPFMASSAPVQKPREPEEDKSKSEAENVYKASEAPEEQKGESEEDDTAKVEALLQQFKKRFGSRK